jgi:hypothetical protein
MLLHQPPESGAGLLKVASKSCDGIPQLLRAKLIATGERNGKSEFQLLQLVFTLRGAVGLTAGMGLAMASPEGRRWEGGRTGSVRRGVGHRSLSFYSATPDQRGVDQAAALSIPSS